MDTPPIIGRARLTKRMFQVIQEGCRFYNGFVVTIYKVAVAFDQLLVCLLQFRFVSDVWCLVFGVWCLVSGV